MVLLFGTGVILGNEKGEAKPLEHTAKADADCRPFVLCPYIQILYSILFYNWRNHYMYPANNILALAEENTSRKITEFMLTVAGQECVEMA